MMGWLAQHFLQFLSGNIYTARQLDKDSSRSVVGKLRLGVLNKIPQCSSSSQAKLT